MYKVLWSTYKPHKGHSAEELLWQCLFEIQRKQLQPYELMFYEMMAAKIPVCTVTTLWAGWSIESHSQQEQEMLLFPKTSRPALGTTKPIPCVPRIFPWWGLSDQGIRLTTHLHLVLRLRISPAALQLTPKSLQDMNRDQFTLTLISRDDGLCPPSHQKRQKIQHPVSTDFHNWCFYLAINNIFPLVGSPKLCPFFKRKIYNKEDINNFPNLKIYTWEMY